MSVQQLSVTYLSLHTHLQTLLLKCKIITCGLFLIVVSKFHKVPEINKKLVTREYGHFASALTPNKNAAISWLLPNQYPVSVWTELKILLPIDLIECWTNRYIINWMLYQIFMYSYLQLTKKNYTPHPIPLPHNLHSYLMSDLANNCGL